jgi:hypothetical protein
MLSAAHHSTLAWLSAIVLLGPLACAHTAPQSLAESLPLSKQERAQLGTIDVVSTRLIPEADLRAPTKGVTGRVAHGAGEGALRGFASGLGIPYPPGAGLVLAPVGIVLGAQRGGAEAARAAKGEYLLSELALKVALTDSKVQEGLRDRVIRVVRDQSQHSVILVPDQDVASRPEGASHPSFAGRGIDTILEVGVIAVRWTAICHPQAPGSDAALTDDPVLGLTVTARARLINAANGKEIRVSTSEDCGGNGTFGEWAANDAQLFREQLDHASQTLAEKIGKGLFGGPTSPEGVRESP